MSLAGGGRDGEALGLQPPGWAQGRDPSSLQEFTAFMKAPGQGLATAPLRSLVHGCSVGCSHPAPLGPPRGSVV